MQDTNDFNAIFICQWAVEDQMSFDPEHPDIRLRGKAACPDSGAIGDDEELLLYPLKIAPRDFNGCLLFQVAVDRAEIV